MKLTIKSKTFLVSSLEDGSRVYSEMRDQSGQGASKFPFGVLSNTTGTIALISYNGKVWKASSIKEAGTINKNELLYNPYL